MVEGSAGLADGTPAEDLGIEMAVAILDLVRGEVRSELESLRLLLELQHRALRKLDERVSILEGEGG